MARQFNPTAAKSCEVQLAFAVADVMAALTVFQELAEVATESAAREKILVGIQRDPWSGNRFTLEELENNFLDVQILPVDDDDHELTDGETNDTVSEGGTITILIRRQVRKSEEVEQEFLFFWDNVSELAKRMKDATKGVTGPILPSIRRPNSIELPAIEEEEAQGVHLTAWLFVDWGNRGRQ